MRLALALVAPVLLGGVAGAAGGQSGWQRHTPLSDPRTEVAAAIAAGTIVTVGGFETSGSNSERVDAYSVADDR